MKIVIVVLTLLITAVAVAEERFDPRQTYGYVFGGMGTTSGERLITMNSGAGFESLFYKRLGVSGELSYFAWLREPVHGLGIFCLNGSYHFDRNRKWSPFITAGYSLFFREGAANLFNIGGGVQLPLKPGHSLRLEFRDHIMSQSSENYHYFGWRIGWTF
jgi:hypothetical protein